MDPRCYFSTTWWRKAKQQLIDACKQKMRVKLLARAAGAPLVDVETFASHLTGLIAALGELNTRVLVLGLLPVDEARFPGSPAHFDSVNQRLQQIATTEGVEFFDWGAELKPKFPHHEMFYRDGFHPNLTGARLLAEILRSHLCPQK